MMVSPVAALRMMVRVVVTRSAELVEFCAGLVTVVVNPSMLCAVEPRNCEAEAP